MSLMEKPKDDRMISKDLKTERINSETGIKRNESCTIKCEGRERVKN